MHVKACFIAVIHHSLTEKRYFYQINLEMFIPFFNDFLQVDSARLYENVLLVRSL